MNVLVLVVYMLVRQLVCVCVRARACVFACLSHDVLWQSLTNRTGASRRWGGGSAGVKDGYEKMQRREEELWSRGGRGGGGHSG